MSTKSTKKLLMVMLLGLAALLPVPHDKIREMMDIMNKANIVSQIPDDAETAEDVLAKYARKRKEQKKTEQAETALIA